MPILYEINKNLTSKTNKPKQEIIIEKVYCYENPFRKAIKKMKDSHESAKTKEDDDFNKNKERWIHDEKESFKIAEPKAKKKEEVEKGLSSQLLQDYY